VRLGAALEAQGHSDEAETWYRQAAHAGQADAMRALGLMLAERGDRELAELWWRRAQSQEHRDQGPGKVVHAV